MNKQEYLSAVRRRLSGLPEEDTLRSLDYYTELIEDRMEEGLSEEEAVAEMPAPEEAADQILLGQPLHKVIRARALRDRKLGPGVIVLLVLGSPIWLSLVLTLGIVLLTDYLVLWAVVLVLWMVDLSFALMVPAAVVGILMGVESTSQLLFALGSALAGFGAAVLFFFVCVWAGRGVALLGKNGVRLLKKIVIGKEETDNES